LGDALGDATGDALIHVVSDEVLAAASLGEAAERGVEVKVKDYRRESGRLRATYGEGGGRRW
jgi:hypothetical protein